MDTKEAAEADLDAMLPRKRQRSVAPRRAGAAAARRVAGLASANEAAARRCMTARQSEADESTDASLLLQPSEIAILCDGS